jgi:hypothetical protein
VGHPYIDIGDSSVSSDIGDVAQLIEHYLTQK